MHIDCVALLCFIFVIFLFLFLLQEISHFISQLDLVLKGYVVDTASTHINVNIIFITTCFAGKMTGKTLFKHFYCWQKLCYRTLWYFQQTYVVQCRIHKLLTRLRIKMYVAYRAFCVCVRCVCMRDESALR